MAIFKCRSRIFSIELAYELSAYHFEFREQLKRKKRQFNANGQLNSIPKIISLLHFN